MLNEEQTIQALKSVSDEDFQRTCSELLEKMGFEISSLERKDDSIVVEGEIERGGKVRDYLIKCTRSEEDLKEDITELNDLLDGNKYGLFLTTTLRDRPIEKTEKIEFVGGTPFYKLLKKFDMIPVIESHIRESSGKKKEKDTSEEKKYLSQDEKNKTKSLGEKGKKAYNNQEYLKAISFFEEVLQIDPEKHAAWNNKALCHLKAGDNDKALSSIEKAISLEPEFEDAYLNKALIHEKKEELEKAKQSADRLIELDPENPEYHYIKAAYLKKLGELESARSSIQKALNIDPELDKAKRLEREIEESIGKTRTEGKKREYDEELKDLKKKNEDLKKELKEKESKISELENELENAGESPDEEIEEKDRRIKELEENIDDFKKEKKQIENKFKMEKNRLRNTIKLKQERLDHLQEENKELKDELEKLRSVEGSTETNHVSKEKAIEELQSLKNVGPELADRIYESGYKDIDDLKEASQDELSEIKGMGSALSKKIYKQFHETKD